MTKRLVLFAALAATASEAQTTVQQIPVSGSPLSYVYNVGEVHDTSMYRDRARVLEVPDPDGQRELTLVLEVSSDWRPPKYGKGGVTRSWNLGTLFRSVYNVALVDETVTIEGWNYETSTSICTYVFRFEEGLLAETLEDKGCVPRAIQSLVGIDGVSAAQIMEAVRTHGAHQTARSLRSDNYPAWASMIRGVWSGDAAFLSVAEALRPGAEPIAAEELDNALFMALARNPVPALKLLTDPGTTDRFYVQSVCTPNLLANDRLPNTAWKALIEERIAALDFGDEQVDAAKRACVRSLHRALNFLPQ